MDFLFYFCLIFLLKDSFDTYYTFYYNINSLEIRNIFSTESVLNVVLENSSLDVCNLIGSVKELTKHTRTARTIVWCALQMLYANASSCASSGSGDWMVSNYFQSRCNGRDCSENKMILFLVNKQIVKWSEKQLKVYVFKEKQFTFFRVILI